MSIPRKQTKQQNNRNKRRQAARQRYAKFHWNLKHPSTKPEELEEKKDQKQEEIAHQPIEPVTAAPVIVPKSRQKV